LIVAFDSQSDVDFGSLGRGAGVAGFCGGGSYGAVARHPLGRVGGRAGAAFGTAARRLPQPLDFGDSYADVVLEGDTLGGVPVAVFFQMNKVTHGLKRVQLEPLGHEINPPAYRAIAAALNAEYGQPTQRCITPPVPDAGFQAAVEERWQHDDAAISAIFRDTTLQAFEGCLYGPASGWCGLHGQILVRISPAAPQSVACHPPAWPG
jgi:hypothetical protein